MALSPIIGFIFFPNMIRPCLYLSTPPTHCADEPDFDESEDIGKEVFVEFVRRLCALDKSCRLNLELLELTGKIADGFAQKSDKDLITEDISYTPKNSDQFGQIDSLKQNELILKQTLNKLALAARVIFAVYCRSKRDEKSTAALLGLDIEFVRSQAAYFKEFIGERTFLRAEAALRHSSPDENFTGSVVAYISKTALNFPEKRQEGILQTNACVGLFRKLPLYGKIAFAIFAVIAIGALITLAKTHTRLLASNPILLPPPTETQTSPKPAVLPVDTPFAEPVVQRIAEQPQIRNVLSGKVVDEQTFEPVVDASIILELPGGELLEAQTNSDGKYFFDSLTDYGNCKIYLYSSEYVGINHATEGCIELQLSEQEPTFQDFHLERACMLEVEVVDDEGSPVSGATVLITAEKDEKPNIVNYYNNNTTDNSGLLVVGGIKPSQTPYKVTVWKILDEQQGGYITSQAAVKLQDSDSIETLRITLSQAEVDIGETSE